MFTIAYLASEISTYIKISQEPGGWFNWESTLQAYEELSTDSQHPT